jgi:L-aspartate oxidase
LLEVIVFSKRIIEKSQSGDKGFTKSKASGKYCLLQKPTGSETSLQLNLPNLEKLLWDKVGIVRSGEGLMEAKNILMAWQQCLPHAIDRASYELNNMVLNARLMTEAALIREESRGAHFRNDFPDTSPSWQRHVTFKAG